MSALSSISILYRSRSNEHVSTIFNLSQPEQGAWEHYLQSQSIAAGESSMPALSSISIYRSRRKDHASAISISIYRSRSKEHASTISISIYRSRRKEHASTIFNLNLSQPEQQGEYQHYLQSVAARARSMRASSSISIYRSRKEHASTIFNHNLSQPEQGACQHYHSRGKEHASTIFNLNLSQLEIGAYKHHRQSQSIAAGARSMRALSSISIFRSRSKEHASTRSKEQGARSKGALSSICRSRSNLSME